MNMREAAIKMLQLKEITDDLKYLNRLNREEFRELFFANSTVDYFLPKWDLFCQDKLSFIWSCSLDKLQIIVDYIEGCKNE
tara:strand:- start:14898 stop:15140 length:243 start_codon:yes stop_codon:yes gene_type:complete